MISHLTGQLLGIIAKTHYFNDCGCLYFFGTSKTYATWLPDV